MIIDSHIHITSPEISKNPEVICRKEPYFALLAEAPANKYADADEINAMMAACDIEKSIVFGFSFMDMGLCREANDYTAYAIKKYPNFIGFMSVSPTDKGAEAEIDRCLKLGLTGIGEIFPDGQNFPIDDENVTYKFCEILKERSLPVIVHTNEPVGHMYPGKTSTTPEKAYKFAKSNPGLKILFAHFGGGLLFYELMPEVKKTLKDVFYDTAAMPFLYDKAIYDTAKSLGIMDKLVFGSDFPLLSPKRYLNDINLDKNDSDKLFRGNILRFLEQT